MIARHLSALLPAIALLTACGSNDNESKDNHPHDAGQDTQAQDAVTSDIQPESSEEAGPCTNTESFRASTIDEGGDPLGGTDIILCVYRDGGKAQCLSPVKTDASGQATIPMPDGKLCLESAAYQVKSFEDMSLTGLYCTVDISTGGHVATSKPDRLVHAPECPRDPLGTPTEKHEIKTPDGPSFSVVPEGLFLFDFDYEDLRALPWNHQAWGWPCFINPSDPPDGLMGFAPEIEVKPLTVDPNAKDALHVSFLNDQNLAPGTVVDLLALGGGSTSLWDNTQWHEGHWEAIGEAVVSDDGTRIETRPGEGLPFGTWVGWKKR